MKCLTVLLFLIVSSMKMYASIPFEVGNEFYQDKYEEIIRFDALTFSTEKLDEKSQKRLVLIANKLKQFEKTSKQYKITLIGHNYNEASYYPKQTKIKFDYNISIDKNNVSKEYLQYVKESLINFGVSEKTLYLYNQGGKFLAYTDGSSKGKELSNRVMVTVYVLKDDDKDSDRDGVFDRYDRCKNTPLGSNVDKNGCPLDSDHDGVYDYLDKCPNTPPKGVIVDEYGCPLDSDSDGVLDYQDKCVNTRKNVEVDVDGCATKKY